MNKLILILGITALLTLAGCDKKGVSNDVVEVNGTKVKVAYINREDLQPYENYTPFPIINSYIIGSPEHKKLIDQYRNFYWSSSPADYEVLAYDYLDGYADEVDTFKKKDLVTANKDKLEAIYKGLPKNKYFSLERNNLIYVDKYDEAKKGFRVYLPRVKEGVNNGDKMLAKAEQESVNRPYEKQLYWGMELAGIRNSEQVDDQEFVYIPKNEDEARAIEAELTSPSASEDIVREFLGRTIGAKKSKDEHTYSGIFMIDGIAVINKKSGKVLFTLSSKEMGRKYQIACPSVALALGMEEIEGYRRYCSDSISIN